MFFPGVWLLFLVKQKQAGQGAGLMLQLMMLPVTRQHCVFFLGGGWVFGMVCKVFFFFLGGGKFFFGFGFVLFWCVLVFLLSYFRYIFLLMVSFKWSSLKAFLRSLFAGFAASGEAFLFWAFRKGMIFQGFGRKWVKSQGFVVLKP